MYPVNSHVDRLSNYVPYENAIDCSWLTFSVHPNQFSFFERDNLSIALHCLTYEVMTKSFKILYLSPFMHDRPHKITLLLLDSPNGENNYYYVCFKNISRLVSSGYSRNHAHYVCLSCLHPFTRSPPSISTRSSASCTYFNSASIRIATMFCYAMSKFNMSFPFYFTSFWTLNASLNPMLMARWFIAHPVSAYIV